MNSLIIDEFLSTFDINVELDQIDQNNNIFDSSEEQRLHDLSADRRDFSPGPKGRTQQREETLDIEQREETKSSRKYDEESLDVDRREETKSSRKNDAEQRFEQREEISILECNEESLDIDRREETKSSRKYDEESLDSESTDESLGIDYNEDLCLLIGLLTNSEEQRFDDLSLDQVYSLINIFNSSIRINEIKINNFILKNKDKVINKDILSNYNSYNIYNNYILNLLLVYKSNNF